MLRLLNGNPTNAVTEQSSVESRLGTPRQAGKSIANSLKLRRSCPMRLPREGSVVAKCANPACNRLFQELSKGRLFLLPPTEPPFASRGRRSLSDYCYWLCPECDVAHTIRRIGSEVVVAERGPGTTYIIPVTPRRRTRRRRVALPGSPGNSVNC